jgi:hypothetical protein
VQLELVGAAAPVTLTTVLHVPTLRGNLLSVAQLARRGIAVEMDAEAATLSRAGAILARAKFTGSAYVVPTAWRSRSASEQAARSVGAPPNLLLSGAPAKSGSAARTHHPALPVDAAPASNQARPNTFRQLFTRRFTDALWSGICAVSLWHAG